LRLFKNFFILDFAKLLSSNVVSQLIAILIVPILTRIYTPEQFGFFALLMSLSSILIIFSCFGFEKALVICQNKLERNIMVNFCFRVLLINFILISLVLIFFSFFKKKLFFDNQFNYIFFLVPILVFVGGLRNIFFNIANSQGRVNAISISTINGSLINNLLAILLGFLNIFGLIVSKIVSEIVSLVILGYFGNKEKKIFKSFNFKEYKLLISKFRKYPFLSMPSNGMNEYIKQIPILFLSTLQSAASAGIYSLSDRVITKPLAIVGQAVSVPFKRKATIEFNSKGSCRHILLQTFLFLFLISILPFTLLYFFAPALFEFIFGSEWKLAGVYVQILVPMFFMQFISSPLSFVLFVANKIEFDFIIHIIMTIVLSFCFVYGLFFQKDIELALRLYSLSNVLIYGVCLCIYYKYSKAY